MAVAERFRQLTARPCEPHVSRLLRLIALSFCVGVTLSLGACTSTRLDYTPPPAIQQLDTKESVVLPEIDSTTACLTEAAGDSGSGAVYAALVLYCAEGTNADVVSGRERRRAEDDLVRVAYDPSTQRFVDRQLAPNITVKAHMRPGEYFLLAEDFGVKGDTPTPPSVGAKTPLVRRTERYTNGIGSFYPPEGLFEPASLSASVVESGDDKVTILLKPSETLSGTKDHAWLAGQAYFHLLDAAQLGKASWTGFINPQKMTSHTDGIYLIERYDPDRIPVLMIHGLRSSPLAWEQLTYAILTSPALHPRFQVWHAFYPTGLPPFYTGSRIRSALNSVLAHFDPEGDDLPSRHMAVVGHSMGGLVAHMLVSDDDGALWRETFTVEAEALNVNDAQRAAFSRIFRAEHEPQVGFVAFIATPHRGSNTADSLIGRIGSSLVELPVRFTSLFLSGESYLEQTTDVMRPYLEHGGPDSVRVLSPDHPLLRVLADLPVEKGVKHISVIGVTEGAACIEDPDCTATDGVVAYESARFSPPEDEMIVQADHNVQRHPDTVAFLLKRLGEWQPVAESTTTTYR